MIPTGSRFLLGALGATLVTGIIYMSVSWGALGTTGLFFLAIAIAFLTGINLYVRDSNVSAKDPAAATESAAAQRAPQASIWPFVGAVGAVLVVVGLVTYPVVFIFGIVALLATVIEWMIEAWSERASADVRFNSGIRQRLAHPYEFPVLAALGAAVIVYSFSRIMLFLSKTGGPVVFGVVAAVVLVAGALVALRPQLSANAMQAFAGLAVLALVAGGVAAAIAGERDIEPHETTGTLAMHGECSTADETHADNNASETVGAKANIHGEIILRSDGTLVARELGIPEDSAVFTATRSNPTNVRFINESGEPARLVLAPAGAGEEHEAPAGSEAPETTDAAPDGTAAPEGSEAPAGTAAEGGDEEHEVPQQWCTARIEDGGSQFLSFKLGQSSSDENHYQFVVPGVEGQSVEVIVP